jgi:hypothetical protein
VAYDSDVRIKEDLKKIGNVGSLKLLVFDESHEDHLLWDKGLTFEVNGIPYGSCDGVWYIDKPWIVNGKKLADKEPVIVVEGTYGTERGNTGSAQYARFAHSLGAVMNGILGIYLIPKFSEYHTADGSTTVAKWRFDMVYGCLGATEIENTPYLMIDAYNREKPTLKEIIEVFAAGDKEKITEIINLALSKMKDYADTTFCETYRTDKVDLNACVNDQRRSYLYNDERIGKILMFNVVSFSNVNFRTNQRYRGGRFRNGHTIVGDVLIHRYWFKKPVDLIFPRWTHDDFKKMDELKQKEWLIMRSRSDINIITLDDLIFQNKNLENELINFMDVLPLLGSALLKKNSLLKKIKEEFREGRITIDRKSVEENNKPIKKHSITEYL